MVKVQEEKVEENSSSYLFDEKYVKKFVKQMLKNHTFVGNYIEQRYVSVLNSYKKIVKIAKNENIFIENLSIAKKRIEQFYAGTKWVGITFPNSLGAPVGFNLWVEFDEEIFGTYKFRVKDVQFTGNQISLKLVVLEPYEAKPSIQNSFRQSYHDLSAENQDEDLETEIITSNKMLTLKNMKEASIFLFLLTAAIVTGGGQLIIFLLDYILKLLREFSNIIKVTTPIFIACFDTISKIFGYVCFLIALLWRDRHSPPKSQMFHRQSIQGVHYQPSNSYRALSYQSSFENSYKGLEYQPKSSVTITELNS